MNIKRIIKYLLLFLMLVLFFTIICPIVPYEGDEWYFIGAMRQPIPYSGIFNPSKVLPEVIEPLCGYVGAFIIKPFTGDYIGSLSLAAAMFISAIITFMSSLFNKTITNKFNLKKYEALIYELLFLIIFFVIFKVENANSYYGFWSKSYNCYFNYLVPALVNACAVLFMMKYDDFSSTFNKYSYFKKGFFLIFAYFTIFSSIQLNIILGAYVIICLLPRILEFIKNKNRKTKEFIKNNFIYIILFLMWSAAVIYDFTGMRGKMVSSGPWITFINFKNTFISLLYLYKLIYKPLIVVTFISIILVIFNSIKNKTNKYVFNLIKIVSILLINTIYIIVLYMKAGSGYATRVDATWGILFYLIMLIIFAFISCNRCYKFTELFIPIFVVIFALVAFNFNYPFQQSIFDSKAAKELDNYIIKQIVTADKKGEASVEVKVPKYENDTNWPQPYNMATWLQNTLYAHKITRNRMYIVFKPDEEVNKKYLNKKYDNMFFFDFERSRYLQ